MKITRPGLTMMLTLLPSGRRAGRMCARRGTGSGDDPRMAILPPCDATGAPLSPRPPAGVYATPIQNLAALLVSGAQNQIARHGFEVVDPRLVEMATGGRVPSSPEMAAEIVQSTKLDATALFMRVRRWEFPYSTMRTNEVIVSLDVILVDPTTAQIVWQVRRPPKPVPLYGQLIAVHADAVAADEVMKEVFAPLGQRLPS